MIATFGVNPARNLTANRIPYAIGGGMLGDDSRLSWNTSGVLVAPDIELVQRGVGSDSLTFKTPSVAPRFVARLGSAGNDLFWYNSVAGINQFVMRGEGSCLFGGETIHRSNGAVQLATHSTPAGGYGFFDFSLYRAGAGLAGLNASLSISGQCVPGYGTFAAPALTPGDSGNGIYNLDPGTGRVMYFKGYAGRSAFRNSTNTGNTLSLSDTGATFAPLLTTNGIANTGNISTSSLDVAAGGVFGGNVETGGVFKLQGLQVIGYPVGGWGVVPVDGVRHSLAAASSQAEHNEALRALIADLHGGGGTHYLIRN